MGGGVVRLNSLFQSCQDLLDPYYGEQPAKVMAVAAALWQVREFLVAADSELSAIAHGRPPSGKEELLRISSGLRKCYEGRQL
jgi:hypothetical protein